MKLLISTSTFLYFLHTYIQTTSLKHDDATCTCIGNAAFSTAQKPCLGEWREGTGLAKVHLYSCLSKKWYVSFCIPLSSNELSTAIKWGQATFITSLSPIFNENFLPRTLIFETKYTISDYHDKMKTWNSEYRFSISNVIEALLKSTIHRATTK